MLVRHRKIGALGAGRTDSFDVADTAEARGALIDRLHARGREVCALALYHTETETGSAIRMHPLLTDRPHFGFGRVVGSVSGAIL